MNNLAFGDNMPSAGNMYLRMKEKGDQIQFRLAQDPVYTGKHFTQKEDKTWDVVGCPRINAQEECDMCNLFFAAKAEQKKLKEAKDPTLQEQIDGLDVECRKFNPSTTFYFPVLNRDTGKMGVLQTTMGTRNKINEFHEAGTDVFTKDFVLRNTGKPGKERYSLTIVDSADTAVFTPEEEVEFEKAKSYDTMQINDGSSQSDEIE
jgi:hypothetical protein